MKNIQINNNVLCKNIYDNMSWIHGNSHDNILITLFLITIEGEQLEYSLNAINNLNLEIPIIVNVIMNICPTNKAYNEMRLRCKTKYFIQNDEDMELYPDAIKTMYNYIENNSNNVFMSAFKLIDSVIGVGNPPIIDCLKLYNNEIMIKYPTYNNGEEEISSVDMLWHKPILSDNYKVKNTNVIIGYHGKHRTHFDLLLRYCKILKSILDPRIKTNSGHLCKIVKAISNGGGDTMNYFNYILSFFEKKSVVDNIKLDMLITKINSYIPTGRLELYNIKQRCYLDKSNINRHCTQLKVENYTKLYSLVAVLCIATNNYGYSKDKYPYDIYNYFKNI